MTTLSASEATADRASARGPRNLAELLARSVAEHGTITALEVNGAEVTYARLWDMAGTIATRVLAVRERPVRVGLCASRTLTAYAGYLAALRLGATVVPINPSAPAPRAADVLRLSSADAVICDENVDDGYLASMTGNLVPSIRLVSADLAGSPSGSDLPPSVSASDDFAYILFTSGSTGTPKGVPVTHGSVLSYLAHVVARYGLGPGARMSQNFELTFDLSVFDLFAALSSGATLVVPTRGELLMPVSYAARRRLTHWFSVPSLVTHAIRSRKLVDGAMPDLRWSLFCGEALTREQAAAWAGAAVNSTLENLYGPTELTIHCAEFRLPPSVDTWPDTANGTIPIGAVLPGLEWIVLGPNLRPAESGELCVRGPQRLVGYLDVRDDHGRFVSWSSGDAAAVVYEGGGLTRAHWYRTGDRVSVVDGVLVHHGRMDRQIKLRGYRIEPGEVEAAVRAVAGVESAAVVLVPAADGGRLACVYTGERALGETLRGRLAGLLPSYMVPTSFIHQDALPLTDNGKTDHARIAALALAAG